MTLAVSRMALGSALTFVNTVKPTCFELEWLCGRLSAMSVAGQLHAMHSTRALLLLHVLLQLLHGDWSLWLISHS
jgi:hypothetical protein